MNLKSTGKTLEMTNLTPRIGAEVWMERDALIVGDRADELRQLRFA